MATQKTTRAAKGTGKRSTKGSSKTPSRVSGRANPADLEKKIERLDREIIKLLNERASLSQKLGKQKAQGAENRNPEKLLNLSADREVLQQWIQANRGPLGEASIRAIGRELLSGVRALRAPLRVAFLGPQYSYSHQAAVERFGQSVEYAPVGTIAAVFEEVNRRQSDFGLVPIENSTDGRVADTLEMFARLKARICGEVVLRIHHYLLAGCPRDEVREVYSKPQALSQCRNWLARHLPAARMVEMTSTAAAAQLAADKPGAAAIASRQAGVKYSLNVLASSIEDNTHNLTRFAVIGAEPAIHSGNDKTSIMFEAPHQPGALADAMVIFKKNQLNLTWIESFPVIGTENEYMFFAEFEGHQNDRKVKTALIALEKKTVRLEVLGSYAKTEPIE